MNSEPDDNVRKTEDWSDLGLRMKLIWLVSFALATLFGIALGLYLTFA